MHSLCAIGRAITHPDAERFPGFQTPCPNRPTQILVLADGVHVQHHDVCGEHMEVLHLAGVVSGPVAVRR